MATDSTQPSGVATEDKPKDRPGNVITDETARGAQAAPPAATGDESNQDDTSSAQTTDESGASDAENQPRKRSRRSRSFERRVRKLQAELAEERASREQDATRIAELEAKVEELSDKAPKPAKPQLRDFQSDEEYAEAYAEWKAGQAAPAPSKKTATKPAANDTPKKQPPRIATEEELKQFVADGTERLGDKFLAAQTDKGMAIDHTMGEFIVDSDVGPEMVVWLHEHPEEMREIFFDDSAVAKVERLQAIEKKLATGSTGKVVTETTDPGKSDKGKQPARGKKTSSAPPPGPEPDRGGTAGGDELEGLDMDQYAARRREQIKASGRIRR